ncbi:MAG TPA: hypothetical protein DHW02_19840 [Ktedonobacter sp.]|nr:hypothetical protein [Ktedonobacter sp.]
MSIASRILATKTIRRQRGFPRLFPDPDGGIGAVAVATGTPTGDTGDVGDIGGTGDIEAFNGAFALCGA